MSSGTYAELFAQKERQYGLPQGYLARTAQIESSFDPNAKNPNSSAGGLFQFIDSTASQYGLRNRFDPYEATDAAARLARDNAAHLRRVLGREPSGAELYLAHQQGAGGAEKLLKDPNAIVGGDEIALNGGRSGMTAGAFASQWLDKFNGASADGASAAVIGGTFDPTAYAGVDGQDFRDRYQIHEENTAKAQAQADLANEGFWADFGAEMSSSSWTSHFLRTTGEGVADPFYTPSSVFGEQGEGLKEFPERYHDMLLEATSKANADARIAWVREDMEQRKKLEAGGWRSTAAGLAAGVADPIPFVAGLLTGGVGLVGRGGLALKAAAGAASGAAFNAGMELVSQEAHSNPYADPLMAALIGGAFGAVGGALARNLATADLAEGAYLGASRAARGIPHPNNSTAIPEAAMPPSGGLANLNAAQNPHVVRSITDDDSFYLTEMQDASVPRGFGGVLDQSVSGQMVGDSTAYVRLLGMNLFDPGAGLKGNAVAPDSVNTVQTATERMFRGQFMSVFQPARNAWIKEQGVFRLNAVARARAMRDFNRQVSEMVENPDAFVNPNPHVKKAADAFSDGMAKWNEYLREAGIIDIPVDRKYVSKIADHDRIVDLDRMFDEKQIHSWLEQAILRHTDTLSEKVVKRMATGYWRNLRRAAYGMGDDLDASLAMRDFDLFKATMKKNLSDSEMLGEDELKEAFDAFTDALGSTQRAEGGSASRGVGYLKRRTLLDYNEKFTLTDKDGNTHRMAVRDLFEQDAELIFGRYTRTMSGRYAFGKMKVMNPDKGELIINGVRNEADWSKIKDSVIDAYRRDGVDPNSNTVKNTLQNLDFAWKRINGIPVHDNATAFNKWARRIKDMQFVRLMSNMGLNQIQEFSKTLALVGPRAAYQQLPSIKMMVKGVRQGKYDANTLTDELMDMTGLGMEGLHSRVNYRLDDDRIGARNGNQLERGIDNALDSLKDVTTSLSGMRVISDLQQRWALKTITQQIANMGRKARQADGSFDYSKIGKGDRDRLATMGVGEEDATLLFSNLLKARYDGNKIIGVNLDEWDAEAVTKFRYFVNRYVDRLVQRNDYGGLAKWMSHPVMSMFTQFRSFVFGAWAKSTLWAANHGVFKGDPKMIALLGLELAMGTATYLVRNAAVLANDEDYEKFMEEKFNTKDLLLNGAARTASASIVPMMIDSALRLANELGVERVGTEDFGFDTEPMFGNVRSSGSPSDAWLGTPVVDQIASMKGAVKGLNNWATGEEEFTQNTARHMLRALPIPTNYIPMTAAFSALIEDLPKK